MLKINDIRLSRMLTGMTIKNNESDLHEKGTKKKKLHVYIIKLVTSIQDNVIQHTKIARKILMSTHV